MNLLLGISLFAVFVILFIRLMMLDIKHPVHLIALLMMQFGVATIYLFMFEPMLIDMEFFKTGQAVMLLGASMWFLADRRRQ